MTSGWTIWKGPSFIRLPKGGAHGAPFFSFLFGIFCYFFFVGFDLGLILRNVLHDFVSQLVRHLETKVRSELIVERT